MIDVDIEFVKSIAVRAGDAAVMRADGISYELKEDSSYVTAIDRDTELFIRESLSERYPGYAFQGEEFGRHGSDDVPLWAVDPIDGTTNMVFGLPYWGVSIGLLDQGIPVAGVFYMPRTGELFWAVRGGSAFRNGVHISAVNRSTFHAEDTLGFTSGSLRALDVRPVTGRIRSLGSIASEVVYAARGALCFHVGCYEGANDLAAALCIASEAGCEAVYLDGEPVHMPDVVREGKTRRPFVVATPQTGRLLRSLIASRD